MWLCYSASPASTTSPVVYCHAFEFLSGKKKHSLGSGLLLSRRHRLNVYNRADKDVHCWLWMDQTGRDWLLIITMDVGSRWRKDEIMGNRQPKVLLKPVPCAGTSFSRQVLLYSCQTRLFMLINLMWGSVCIIYFVLCLLQVATN